jgi:predicted kinase
MAAELILFVGLQGSGKSTFYQERFSRTHVLVSKDLLGRRHLDERSQLLIAESLDAFKPVVVDNCHVTVADREVMIRTAGSSPVRAYVFKFDVKACIRRNNQRTGKARVPLVALYTKAKYFTDPSWSEGFDSISDVAISEEGCFEVTERSPR